MRYSIGQLSLQAIRRHLHWPSAWRDAAPKPCYDAVIIGGGGHGLATGYYLAKEHGIANVAVLERGYIGSGNTGRNTAVIRSNYLLDDSARFYEFSLKLWEGLSQELNFNVMFSQRGVISLAHSDAQRDALLRRGNGMHLHGIDAEWLDRDQVAAMVPILDCSAATRFPINGALIQRRGGTARHDAVAWGYARAANRHGVDIIQNCEVKGIRIDAGRVTGIETTRGAIATKKVGIAVAGNSSRVAALAGLRLPIETHVLQAFVSEPLKPLLDTVVTFGAGHYYVSQSDKGELVMGGDLDFYNSYAQRGNLPSIEEGVAAGLTLFPCFSRLRMMRHWGGAMDMTMDGSPIIGNTSIRGLYLNGGWCYGGFKATPASGWTFAHTIARDAPHPLNAPFNLERFARGAVIDEKGAGPTPHAQ
ncbi:MAG: sarcosine oxidase subunit beta family protein [Betaproteobacteria bacterium]